jgi:hypothetical protein
VLTIGATYLLCLRPVLSLPFNLGSPRWWWRVAPVDHERSPWLIMLLAKEEDQHKGCGG